MSLSGLTVDPVQILINRFGTLVPVAWNSGHIKHITTGNVGAGSFKCNSLLSALYLLSTLGVIPLCVKCMY